MDKHKYLTEIRRQLSVFYRQVKAGHTPSSITRHRTEGFMQAGIFLDLYTQQERDALLEDIHQEILGMSVSARQEQLGPQWQSDCRDYSEFDTPTWNRRKKR